MSQHFELGFNPPPGVALIQWSDGSIRIRYTTANVSALRESFVNLAKQLKEQALAVLETARQLEIERQKMPLSRLETLDVEIKRLKDEPTETMSLNE